MLSACSDAGDKVGMDLYKEGKYAEAIAVFDAYLADHPKDADSFYNRGCAHEQLGNWESALSDYQEAAKQDPKKPEFWLGAGNINYRNKNYGAVVSNMESLLQRVPNSSKAQVLKGRAHAQLTQLRQAMDAFELAIKADPRNGEAHLYKGWLEVSAGGKATGCTSMREAKRLNAQGADEYLDKYCK